MFITFVLKRVVWIALGVAVALEVDRWLQTRRSQYTPNAIAGRMLDGINRRLEQNQA